jgi:hypothetical protein
MNLELKRLWPNLLVVVALVALVGSGACNDRAQSVEEPDIDATTRSEEIEDLIEENEEFELLPEKSLSIDREVQVEDPWTETEVVEDEEGESEVTTTWQTVREYYSALNHPDKFVLYNVNASVLWPGNLIQGNSISSGVINPIPISGEDRRPMDLFISVVTGGAGGYSATVDEPNGSRVFQAMNEVVGQHYGSTPGQTTLEISRVYNMNHVMFNLNAGYSVPSTEISGALSINWEEKKERVMVKFTQQYYSIAYDSPQNAEDVFSSSVTSEDLEPFTSPSNPVCYIDSVTFGRLFLFVYESNDSSINLEANLNAAFNGIESGNATAEAAYDRVTRSSTVKAYALGGNVEEALQVATDYSSLSNYLLNGAQLSAESPGAPISYTIRYLKSAGIVRMNNTLEYYVDKAVPVGESTSVPTETSSTIYLDHIVGVASDDGGMSGGAEGAFGVKVFKFEDGVKTEIHDTGLVAEYGGGELVAEAQRAINQAVPAHAIKNVVGNKIIIQLYGYEEDPFNDHWFWLEKEFIYTHGVDGNSWRLSTSDPRDNNDTLYFRSEQPDGEFVELALKYSLTIDGITLQ